MTMRSGEPSGGSSKGRLAPLHIWLSRPCPQCHLPFHFARGTPLVHSSPSFNTVAILERFESFVCESHASASLRRSRGRMHPTTLMVKFLSTFPALIRTCSPSRRRLSQFIQLCNPAMKSRVMQRLTGSSYPICWSALKKHIEATNDI